MQQGVDESYTLTFSADRTAATVTSATIFGARHGLETFSQLCDGDRESGVYSCSVLNVTDAPRFPYRGLLIDAARHWLPPNLLLSVMDAMSFNKLNSLQVGFGIDWRALGGFLAAVILVGQLMANYLSNAGGAWDNAKKYIEDGNHGGKGSDPYRAAVIADTVGDPFKDTAGPALNPLIKVMNLVSLLILPAIISLKDNDGARFSIAAAALVMLMASIIYSARQSSTISASN